MKSVYLIGFFMFLVCGNSQSQNDSIKNRAEDIQYTPSGIDLFNNGNGDSKNGSRVSSGLAFVVKAVPFELMRGNLLIESETKVQDNMSIVFSLGYNVMNDFVLNNFNDPLFSGSTNSYLGIGDLINRSTYVRGGIVVQFGLREYMKKLRLNSYGYTYMRNNDNDGRVINDWYKDISFKFSKANYAIDTAYAFKGKRIKGGNSLETKSFYVLSGLGYSFATNGKIKAVHDIYFNLGLRILSFTKYALDYDYNVNTQQITEFYQKSNGRSVGLFSPAIHVGYSFGFGM